MAADRLTTQERRIRRTDYRKYAVIARLYKMGKTTREIAAELGAGRGTVRKALRLHKIQPRSRWEGTPETRFWEKVTLGPYDECWLWQACLSRLSYGHFGWRGKVTEAHRVAYEIWYGVRPGDRHVLHTCDNRRCCNPHHLYLGTHKDNMRDMVEKGRLRNAKTGPLPAEMCPWL